MAECLSRRIEPRVVMVFLRLPDERSRRLAYVVREKPSRLGSSIPGFDVRGACDAASTLDLAFGRRETRRFLNVRLSCRRHLGKSHDRLGEALNENALKLRIQHDAQRIRATRRVLRLALGRALVRPGEHRQVGVGFPCPVRANDDALRTLGACIGASTLARSAGSVKRKPRADVHHFEQQGQWCI